MSGTGNKRGLRLALIGDPVGHSLSPEIHGCILRSFGEPYSYRLINVEKGGLAEFAAYARENLDGFNVTMPHKTDIIPFMSEMDESAAFYDAVNTVTLRDGCLRGYNTDADGLAASLREHGVSLSGKRVVLTGAGGSAKTAALLASREGAASLCVLTRNREGYDRFCSALSEKIAIPLSGARLSGITEHSAGCDVFINATPLGMHGIGEDYDDFSFLRGMAGGAVCDLIYNPLRTRLLSEAESLGLAAVNGLRMLAYQAVMADAVFLRDLR